MPDPRLSSIHLEALPRRLDFRRARERLIGTFGEQTLALEHNLQDANAHDLRTFIERSQANAAAPARPGLKYWLMDQEAVYPLKVGLNTIGRMPDNDVAVLDGSVSRRHCAIVVHASAGCELHDTASKNGTFLNGQRISAPTALNPGDEIRLCDRKLTFVANDGEQPPSPRDDTHTHAG